MSQNRPRGQRISCSLLSAQGFYCEEEVKSVERKGSDENDFWLGSQASDRQNIGGCNIEFIETEV